MMSSYDFNKYSIAATTPPCPPVKLSNLTHLELHTPHFTDQEWSQILRCLTGSKLISLSILGPPPFIPLFRFMARHPNLESLEAYSHWAHFDGTPPSGVPQRIVQMPHLESLNGPPCHLQIILKSLSHVPETLSLHFRPDRAQSYSEFVTQIMETVRLCNGIDSNLNITIHFRECHFALEHAYKFNVHAMQALGLNCPGAKSLYLFLPTMKEEDVKVSCLWSLNILVLMCTAGYLHAVALSMACFGWYAGPCQPSKARVDCGLGCKPISLGMGYVVIYRRHSGY